MSVLASAWVSACSLAPEFVSLTFVTYSFAGFDIIFVTEIGIRNWSTAEYIYIYISVMTCKMKRWHTMFQSQRFALVKEYGAGRLSTQISNQNIAEYTHTQRIILNDSHIENGETLMYLTTIMSHRYLLYTTCPMPLTDFCYLWKSLTNSMCVRTDLFSGMFCFHISDHLPRVISIEENTSKYPQ